MHLARGDLNTVGYRPGSTAICLVLEIAKVVRPVRPDPTWSPCRNRSKCRNQKFRARPVSPQCHPDQIPDWPVAVDVRPQECPIDTCEGCWADRAPKKFDGTSRPGPPATENVTPIGKGWVLSTVGNRLYDINQDFPSEVRCYLGSGSSSGLAASDLPCIGTGEKKRSQCSSSPCRHPPISSANSAECSVTIWQNHQLRYIDFSGVTSVNVTEDRPLDKATTDKAAYDSPLTNHAKYPCWSEI